LRTKRLILFKFHDAFDICDARVARLQALNPGIKIHGLYGGPPERLESADSSFLKKFESLHVLTRDAMWCWLFSGFLGVDSWYKAIGRRIDFDVLHVMEWDLLTEDSLENLYQGIEPDSIAVTAPTPVAALRSKWLWVTDEEKKGELDSLLEWIRVHHGVTPVLHACFLAGACYPKAYFEAVSRWDLPSYCIDEVLVPIYAQLAKIRVTDTGFLRNWTKFSKWSSYLPSAVVSDPFAGPRRNRIHRWFVDFNYLNCDGHEIPVQGIRRELAHMHGRRVFHPVRYRTD